MRLPLRSPLIAVDLSQPAACRRVMFVARLEERSPTRSGIGIEDEKMKKDQKINIYYVRCSPTCGRLVRVQRRYFFCGYIK